MKEISEHKSTWGVIFDMDGVLIDSYRHHFTAWQKILPGLGLAMTEDQFAPLFGRTNPDILSALFPTLPQERYPVIDKEKEALFPKWMGRPNSSPPWIKRGPPWH